MRKNSKRSLLLVLVLLMVIASVAGCQKAEEAAPVEETTTENTTTAVEETNEEFDMFAKYDEPITLTTVRAEDASVTFREGASLEDNPYLDLMADRLGINVEYEWIVDISQEKSKFSTTLAAGNAPDFYKVKDSGLFAEIVRNGMAMDITEIYEKYASPALKEQDNAFPEAFNSTFYDGKMYGIASLGFGLICQPNLIWIREDWLAESGKEIPKTMDELEELALIFMEEQDAAYGMAVDRSMTTVMNSVLPYMNAYDAYSKVWIEKDGELVYGSVQPEMKAALAKLQEFYAQGIIDTEFSVKDPDKVHEDIASGKVGIVGGANWLGFTSLKGTVELDETQTWIAIDVPTGTGNEVKLQADWPVGEYWVISPDCEHPEAVIKMLSLYMEEFDKGTFWGDDFEGIHFAGAPIYQTQPAKEYGDHIAAMNALETGETDDLTPRQNSIYDAFIMWTEDKDPAGFGRYMQQGPTGAYCVLSQYVDEGRVMLDELRGAYPEDYAAIKSTLEKMEDDTFAKIIMGESLDEFDKFVENWYNLGGTDVTEAINEIYNK